MPRPTGQAAREMEERVAEGLASGKLKPRVGHNSTVTVRHVEPSPVSTTRTRKSTSREYPGFQPKEKTCRRDGCENTFMPQAPAAAYCSKECRDEAIRGQRRATDRDKRDRKRAYEEEQGLTRRTCRLEGCDVEFKPEHFNSRYCSPEHRAEATRIIKARARAKREGKPAPPMPTSATQQAIAHVAAAAAAMNGQPVSTPDAAEYLTRLWERVQQDPDCPGHVFDRLERLLGLTPAETTLGGANADS